jgi:hypothetical protein
MRWQELARRSASESVTSASVRQIEIGEHGSIPLFRRLRGKASAA